MTSSLLHYAAAMDAYPPRSLANSLSLAARLPDIPRWVEARALLPDAESIFVIGAPDPTVVRDVAEQGASAGVIATLDPRTFRFAGRARRNQSRCALVVT